MEDNKGFKASVWGAYNKICHLGKPEVKHIFDGVVVVQEKVDGSQFSFGVFDGELKMRSKGREFAADYADNLFKTAARQACFIKDELIPDHVYRGEYLSRPKHNALAYDRVPSGNIALFDIEGPDGFMTYDRLKEEAERIGVESVPVLYVGSGSRVTREMILEFLDRTSFLGGQKIEGVVIKRYGEACLMAKHVSDKFKEVHRSSWKESNPGGRDIIGMIIEAHRTQARWNKAICHLRDDGRLEESPRDIGALIKEVQRDTMEECREEIKEMLWRWAGPRINRGIVNGLPEWYKGKLLDSQFGKGDEVNVYNAIQEGTEKPEQS